MRGAGRARDRRRGAVRWAGGTEIHGGRAEGGQGMTVRGSERRTGAERQERYSDGQQTLTVSIFISFIHTKTSHVVKFLVLFKR